MTGEKKQGAASRGRFQSNVSQHASEITLCSATTQKGSKGNDNEKKAFPRHLPFEENGVSIMVCILKHWKS